MILTLIKSCVCFFKQMLWKGMLLTWQRGENDWPSKVPKVGILGWCAGAFSESPDPDTPVLLERTGNKPRADRALGNSVADFPRSEFSTKLREGGSSPAMAAAGPPGGEKCLRVYSDRQETLTAFLIFFWAPSTTKAVDQTVGRFIWTSSHTSRPLTEILMYGSWQVEKGLFLACGTAELWSAEQFQGGYRQRCLLNLLLWASVFPWLEESHTLSFVRMTLNSPDPCGCISLCQSQN